MYAVIVSGGKQHRVVEGEVLKLELLEAEIGSTISFDQVLMVSKDGALQIGQPLVAGAVVTAEVLDIGRHDKVRILKFRRRKHHMKRMGHRQWFTAVKITAIQA